MTDEEMCEAVINGLEAWALGDEAIIGRGVNAGRVVLIRRVPASPDPVVDLKWLVAFDSAYRHIAVVYESDLERP